MCRCFCDYSVRYIPTSDIGDQNTLICINNFDKCCQIFCRCITLSLFIFWDKQSTQHCPHTQKKCLPIFEEIKNIGLKGRKQCGWAQKRELYKLKYNSARQKSNIWKSFNFLLICFFSVITWKWIRYFLRSILLLTNLLKFHDNILKKKWSTEG